MRILVIAEHDGATLRPVSRLCLTFAQQIATATSGDVTWLVLGSQLNDVAADASKYAQALIVDSDALGPPLAEPLARIIAAIVRERNFDVVCAAASTFSKDCLPRAAALLGGAMASDVTRHEFIREQLELDSPRFAGAVTATLRLTSSPQFVTVRASAYPAAQPATITFPVEKLSFDESIFACRGRSEGVKSKKSARPDVTEARVVVSGGRALKNSDDFERLVGGLADALGGATGSSRALVDAGITPNELQVGQTGKIVAPEIYIALGISGAVQHLAGMKNSRTIVAINSDPEAPIFDVADVGLVGDVYAIVPELIDKLKKGTGPIIGER
jgi:electron transfer flavoprotein alpha subunit